MDGNVSRVFSRLRIIGVVLSDNSVTAELWCVGPFILFDFIKMTKTQIISGLLNTHSLGTLI